MIINIHFDEFIDNKFIFDGPYLYLDPDCKYTVSLLHLNFNLDGNPISRDNDLWALSSSLVDRSPANPYQSISYFTWTKSRLTQNFIPCSFVEYPLEVHQLENPQFEIRRIRDKTNLKIKSAFIQLEITKSCSVLANA